MYTFAVNKPFHFVTIICDANNIFVGISIYFCSIFFWVNTSRNGSIGCIDIFCVLLCYMFFKIS